MTAGAIIRIENGIVHLVHAINSDTQSYEEYMNEDGTFTDCEDNIITDENQMIQLETYDYADAWVEPKDNPRLADDFWGLWCDWNGQVCGGIYLTDNFTYDLWDKEIEKCDRKNVPPEEIASLPDGLYHIEADVYYPYP